jgi:hypothetical protein
LDEDGYNFNKMNKVVKDQPPPIIDSDTQKQTGYIARKSTSLAKDSDTQKQTGYIARKSTSLAKDSDTQKHIRYIAHNSVSLGKLSLGQNRNSEIITTRTDFTGKNKKKTSFHSKNFPCKQKIS